jgi:S-adenosyl methyltransferase
LPLRYGTRVPFQARAAGGFADLAFAGLGLVPPGLVAVSEWRPETEAGRCPLPSAVVYYGVVGRKPA